MEGFNEKNISYLARVISNVTKIYVDKTEERELIVGSLLVEFLESAMSNYYKSNQTIDRFKFLVHVVGKLLDYMDHNVIRKAFSNFDFSRLGKDEREYIKGRGKIFFDPIIKNQLATH